MNNRTVGVLIDKIRDKDVIIAREEQGLAKIRKEREELELKLLDAMRKAGLKGAIGKRGQAVIRKTLHVSVAKWPQFRAYVMRHKALDLFQNRISTTAYKERLEAGEKVPGLKVFEKTHVTIVKRNT